MWRITVQLFDLDRWGILFDLHQLELLVLFQLYGAQVTVQLSGAAARGELKGNSYFCPAPVITVTSG